jgi:hypothetical protein
VQVQVFTDNSGTDAMLGGLNFAPMTNSPTFVYNKLRSDTILKITYQDTFFNQGPLYSTCTYQLRVDGNTSGLEFGPPVVTVSNLASTTSESTGIFGGLSAGSHVLSFWHRQVVATMCIRNSGGYGTVVTVEEIKVGQ